MIDESKIYKFPCGHNNGYKINLYPFEWVCNVCNSRHSEDKLIEVSQ